MKFILLSSTSKSVKENKKLPSRFINHEYHKNYLISDKKFLHKIIEENENENITFVADSEKKQSFSLYDELSNMNVNVIDYKPNDLTVDAADLAILNYFSGKVESKNIGIFGTGNIAFKLALRLSERNANICIYGRNEKKIKICVDALKQVTFDESHIHIGETNAVLDCFVSFVDAYEVITNEYNTLLKNKSLCLDGGIGNFSKEFISTALINGHDVRRLDVRQSQEIMDGYINSRINSQFNKILGRDVINDYPVVAGGIIGKDGEVIVDKIVNPSKVVGIANGIGGVKNESDLNTKEQIKVREVQSAIQQGS